MRTCVVTRTQAEPSSFVRLVLSPDGELLVDYRCRLPGRGAWVLPTRENLLKLEAAPKLLSRSFRTAVDTQGVLSKVQAANHRHLCDALSLAARTGRLISGQNATWEFVESGRAQAVGFASDASTRLKADFAARFPEFSVYELDLDREELGARIGKGTRAIFALGAGRALQPLMNELGRMQALR
ncbi:MAG: DUF448 domain-containing protein [Myxococcota bacterium]|nr:DUF448 domain-containing protein [Myxococcota bacterium]